MPNEISVKPLVDILSEKLSEQIVMSGEIYVYISNSSAVDKNIVEEALVLQDKDFKDREQEQANNEAKQYLAETDWYVVRFAETGVLIPDEIKDRRVLERTSIKIV